MNIHSADTGREIDALHLDLRESDKRYRTLFDLVPAPVYTIDRDGVIQNFNRRAAELWGREPPVGEIPTNDSVVQLTRPEWP